MAQVPELLKIAKMAGLGGVQVRSGLGLQHKASMEQQIAVADARADYEKLRRGSAPDDIAPELFLYAALYENQFFGDMKPVVDEMLRKQPGNGDVKVLAEWVRARIAQ
ncbi:MAG: hypothetical protein EXR29_13565 [Betaproteobacteria bacterium]|nr:hypothetical protein [Betaproteobacteria bacterium]